MLRVAEHFEKSDTGRQRRANEDSYFVRAPLFVVADGMGGAQAGEVASQLAAESFAVGLPDGASPTARLEERVREANRRIHERQQGDRALHGMGTTITAAYLDGDELALAHVGDSRAYLLRDGELTRLTRDHTLVEELVRRGELTEQEAAEHPQRSIITRALGPEQDVEIDLTTHPVRAGDVLLLCSDGLTGMIDEAEVRAILARGGSLAEAGRTLVAAANDAGGRDNITVVLFRVEEVAQGAAVPPPAAPHPDPPPPPAPPRVMPPRGAAERGAPRRRRHAKLLGALAAVAILLGLVSVSGWIASRAVFFVGTDDQGLVTVYRGMPWDLPAGVRLYEEYYVSGVPAVRVPAGRREGLLDHRLRSREDVRDLIAELERGQLEPGQSGR